MQDRLSNQDLDAGAIVNRVLRLVRLDMTALEEVRDNSRQTVPALAVVLTAILLGAIGGWLWLAIEVDGLSTGRVLLREVLLGTIFAAALWGVWVLITEVVLSQVYGQQVDRLSLIRCMGYAAAPGALMLLLLVPSLSFGFGLVAIGGWWLLSDHAIRIAAPGVAPAQASMANLAGFAVFALVLALLADSSGMAPGVFVHAADLGEYYDLGGISLRFNQVIEGAQTLLA